MNYLKEILFRVLQKPSLYLFIFLIIFSVDRYRRWVDFDAGNFPFTYDVDQYYSYLPAQFIHHDLSFSFPHSYWTTRAPNGNHIPKVTMGMAIMYSPFFILGHAIAKATDYTDDGYSLPYKGAVHFGSVLYTLLGLWLCRKNLLRYFSEYVTFISLVCVYFGTNLFYYTYGHGEMPHAYLFFLFSAFIFYVLKWRQTGRFKYLLAFCFLAGFATLIRPTECLALLFPLLVDVKSLHDLRQRIRSIFSYGIKLLPALALFVFPFFLQMIYWKIYAGSWLYFSYGSKERFFFNDPQILNFLFSFRKGWLVYTPMMIFALIGIAVLKREARGLTLFLTLYLTITVYVLSCWWDWPFGGSFGCRAMIQSYAFLIFGLAGFLQFALYVFTNKVVRYAANAALLFIFLLLIDLNSKQSWKFKYGIIPSDGMTKEAYFFVLGKEKFTAEELVELQTMIKPSNREALMRGERD